MSFTNTPGRRRSDPDDKELPPPAYRASLGGPPTHAHHSRQDKWDQFGAVQGPSSSARGSGHRSSKRAASSPNVPIKGDYFPTFDHPRTNSPQSIEALDPCKLDGFTYTGKVVSNRDPLKPPPPALSRPPNPECTYPLLPQPLRIPGQSTHLNSGFQPLFPAPQLLLAHDVHPSDISRLLEDCHIQGARNLAEDLGANAALGMSLMPGLFAADAIVRAVTRRRKHKVADLVRVWDEAFFAPRRLCVAIEYEGLDGARLGGEAESKGYGSDGVCAGMSREPVEKAARRQQKEQKKAAKRSRQSVGRLYLEISNR